MYHVFYGLPQAVSGQVGIPLPDFFLRKEPDVLRSMPKYPLEYCGVSHLFRQDLPYIFQADFSELPDFGYSRQKIFPIPANGLLLKKIQEYADRLQGEELRYPATQNRTQSIPPSDGRLRHWIQPAIPPIVCGHLQRQFLNLQQHFPPSANVPFLLRKLFPV